MSVSSISEADREINVLDVCSGYSASTLAWEGLGFHHVGYAEIEAFPCAVLGARYGASRPRYMPDPDGEGLSSKDRKARIAMRKSIAALSDSHFGNRVVNFGDFTQIREDDVGPLDALTGGTPCQSFSVAGKRLGLDDPRGNLTLEFLALAKRLRVPWLAWENVPGFLSHDDGRTMGTFLGLLGELGYGWAYRVLDAQYIRVDGHERAVPQRRRRLMLVGHLGDSAGPAAVLFERESLRGDSAPRRRSIQDVARPLASGSQRGSGYRNDADTAENLIASAGISQGCCGETAPTLNAAFGSKLGLDNQHIDSGAGLFIAHTLRAQSQLSHQADRDTLVAHSLRGEGFDASEDGTGRGTPLTVEYGDYRDRLPGEAANDYWGRMNEAEMIVPFDKTQITSKANGSNHQNGDPCHPLAREAHPPAIAFQERGREGGRNVEWQEDIAYSLNAPSGGGRRQELNIAAPTAYRITPNDGAYASGDISPALTTGTDNSAISLVTQWAVRRLTPTECARLMGIPDNFLRIIFRGKPAADGPIYKAAGNSQAGNMMRWIGHGLADVIRAQRASTEDHLS